MSAPSREAELAEKHAETQKEDVFEFNAATHVYKLNGKRMTGVTTILGVINKPLLIAWSARVAVEHIKANLSYKRFKLLRKGFVVVKAKILDEALTMHTKKKNAGATKGTDVHELVEQYIKTCIETNGGSPYPAKADPRIMKFVEWTMTNNIKLLASEKQFYSKTLFVAGTADLMFEKEGKRFVGDIKTFKKLWDRTPMFQCAGYAYLAQEMGEPPFDGYCVLRLSEDGSFEEKWSYDVVGDTRAFLAACELYRQLAQWN